MTEEILDFDEMWDYSNPQETEAKFRELLSKRKYEDDKSYYLQLQTQLARTQGLQQKFDEAHEILDVVASKLSDDLPLTKVRYLLERGRSHNSNKEKEKSIPIFEESFEISQKHGFDFFTVDAAHMLGIAETGEKLIEWNEIAIDIAEKSSSERAKGWLGSLYNNLAWTYNFQEKFENALDLFERALAFREKQGKLENILIAKWCIGRTYRYLDRNDDALDVQLKLQEERETNNLGPGGYNQEELGELYLLRDEKEKASYHFKLAYEELKDDIWLVKDEPERLERMKSLAAND